MENKYSKRILFLTIFFNLTGFAIMLPLSPALLGYYLPTEEANGGWLGEFVIRCQDLASALGHEDPTFITSVFFGCSLASIYAFLQFIFSPIWGRLSDRYGRKNILLYTLTGTALSYALWIFAGSFQLFILSRILAGIMAGNLSVATAAIADVTSKKNRTKGMALIGIAFSLGFIIGPAFGGTISQINPLDYLPRLEGFGINPFSSPALAATILAIINLGWVVYKFDETLPQEKRSYAVNSLKLLETTKAQAPSILWTNISYFIFLLAFSGLEFTLAFLATERFEYTPTQIGGLFVYIGVILILTQGYIVRRASFSLGERALGASGIVFGIISFALIAYAFKQPLFYIGSGFLALGIGLVSPSLSSLVSLYATETTQGRYLGVFRSAGSLARACGPVLAAFPYFYYGAETAYISVALLLLIPLGIVISLPKPDKSSAETRSAEEEKKAA